MGEIVSKSVPLTCRGHDFPSLWLWSPREPDRLIVLFLEDPEDPNAWHVGADVLDGDVLVDDMKLSYVGKQVYLTLDGDQDGVARVVEMCGPADRLLDFHLDIQVAKSASTFQRELRGLIGG
jgi:hypothetical protein